MTLADSLFFIGGWWKMEPCEVKSSGLEVGNFPSRVPPSIINDHRFSNLAIQNQVKFCVGLLRGILLFLVSKFYRWGCSPRSSTPGPPQRGTCGIWPPLSCGPWAVLSAPPSLHPSLASQSLDDPLASMYCGFWHTRTSMTPLVEGAISAPRSEAALGPLERGCGGGGNWRAQWLGEGVTGRHGNWGRG